MIKKCLAMVLAVSMLLCMTGCGAANEPQGDPSSDVLTEGVEEQQPADKNNLSFEMVYSLGNNDELNNFVKQVAAKEPTSYTISASGEGYEATATLYYNVPEVTLEMTETIDGKTTVETFENIQLDIPLMCRMYMTQDGKVDANAFMGALIQTGLYGWYMTNPTIFMNCVRCLVVIMPNGQSMVFDYYYDEEYAEKLQQQFPPQEQP